MATSESDKKVPGKTKKLDFIELEFTAKNLSNNEVFDSNVLEHAKKINPNIKEVRPLIICIGQGMVVPGFDAFLEDKEIGKKYVLKLEPEKAFGKRKSELIRLIPMAAFKNQSVVPRPGMTFAIDDSLVKIVSVSGGRVMVDFNNPVAGKDVEYDFVVKRIVTDAKEKIDALQDFFFRQKFEFEINESEKKAIFKDLRLMAVLQAFAQEFKKMTGYTVEILETKNKAENSKERETKEKIEQKN